MCGINGIFAYGGAAAPIDMAELIRTREHMAARGPDGVGDWRSSDGRVGLGHRRLAIIDPRPEGAQPMSTADGRLWITFNGEIYNYEALRNELLAQGIVFRSHSDTEVLLYLYASPWLGHGETAARDVCLRHLGTKPSARCSWRAIPTASSRSTIPREIGCSDSPRRSRRSSRAAPFRVKSSRRASPGFLLWGSVPEPYTTYRDIQALPAGSTLRVSSKGVDTPRHYWDIAEVVTRSIDAAKLVPPGSETEYLREVLLDSVRAHLVADVPVGAFLSAGLDSSAVVGLARELSAAPIETITLTTDEFRGTRNDEAPLAAEIARHLDVRHRLRVMSTQEFESDLPAFLAAMDQPTIDGPQHLVYLQGDGRDGSPRSHCPVLVAMSCSEAIRHSRVSRAWSTAGSALNRVPVVGRLFCGLYSSVITRWFKANPKYAGLLRYGGTFRGAYMIERGVVKPWELAQVLDRDVISQGLERLGDERTNAFAPSINGFAKVSILESTRYMRNQLLRDSDWAGMAHSLEIRVPLVDSVVIERLAGLAATGRFQYGKAALPRTLTKGLPSAVASRPKTGFTVPLWQWLRKSPAIGDWKRVKFLLRRPNVHDYSRWAYTLLSITPDTARLLKA